MFQSLLSWKLSTIRENNMTKNGSSENTEITATPTASNSDGPQLVPMKFSPLWMRGLISNFTFSNSVNQFKCGLCVNWSHYANIFGPSHYLRCRPQYYYWHQVLLTTFAQNHGYHINSMNIRYCERIIHKYCPKYYPCLGWEYLSMPKVTK